MTTTSKKVKKVIDVIRMWNISTTKSPKLIEVDEQLKQEHFQVGRVAIHGFPYQPTCIDFDPIQKLVAIGTQSGSIRIFGRPGINYMLRCPSQASVIQVIFLVNEGGLISICKDDLIHLWNIRQKSPEVVHSLQFKREHLTCGHVPVGSGWLYLGTEKGNIHFVSVQRFATSGYVINWNKAIDIKQSTHPGRVIKISGNPVDASKLLIAYSTGFLVLWDLKNKAAETRFKYTDNVNDFSWHWDGKQFMTCHKFGLLATWTSKQNQPISVIRPHSAAVEVLDGSLVYEPIYQVQWLPARSGEPFIIFTGGYRRTTASSSPAAVPTETNPLNESFHSANMVEAVADTCPLQTCSLTVKRGKRLVMMQMDYGVIKFIPLYSSPYLSETADAYAAAALLEQDLVVVDLLSPNYATFENPYPMNLAVSPVTAILYLVDCPVDLVPAFYSVGSRATRSKALRTTDDANLSIAADSSFTDREWPITGGDWGSSYKAYPELVITGHADGSLRFWDASEVTLTPLYKFRTTRCFNTQLVATKITVDQGGCSTSSSNPTSHHSVAGTPESSPFAINLLHICPDSRRLLTASSSHVCLLHFTRQKTTGAVPVLDVHISCIDEYEDFITSVGGDAFTDDNCGTMTKETVQQVLTGANRISHHSDSCSSFQSAFTGEKEMRVFVPVLTDTKITWPPGYQPTLICRLGVPIFSLVEDCRTDSPSITPPSSIVAISLNTAVGILVFGNASGLAIVDYVNRVCLFNTSILEIFDVYPQVPARSSGRTPAAPASFANDMKVPEVQSNVPGIGSSSSFSPSLLPKMAPYPSTGSGESTTAALYSVSTTPGSSGATCRHSKTVTYRNELKRAKSQVFVTVAMNQRSREGRVNSEKYLESSIVSQSLSLSTSTSSLDRLSSEAIRTVRLMDSYARKQDANTIPCLWIGTNRGNVIVMNLKQVGTRATQDTGLVLPTGSIFRLHGEIVYIGFLDMVGEILSVPSERWEELSTPVTSSSSCDRGNTNKHAVPGNGDQQLKPGTSADRPLRESLIKLAIRNSSSSTSSSSGATSGCPVGGRGNYATVNVQETTPGAASPTEADRQLLVICSDKRAWVVALPSQTCLYTIKITETSQVVSATIQRLWSATASLSTDSASGAGTACFLSCYLANGHFVALSLPSLRLLMDVDYLPLSEHIKRSFAFGQHGQLVYLTSTSELVKVTWSSDICGNLRDMQGDLFLPCNMPEPPRQNFLKTLFTGTSNTLDREELFGQTTSGKGTSVLVPNPNIEKMGGHASGATSELGRARQAAVERGERLQQLDLLTQEMADSSKGFARSANLLAAKYEKKDKRWGWPL